VSSITQVGVETVGVGALKEFVEAAKVGQPFDIDYETIEAKSGLNMDRQDNQQALQIWAKQSGCELKADPVQRRVTFRRTR
jgi:hypothetical protein